MSKIFLKANRASFADFFESGMEESISPFLTKDSRKWGKNIRLKASILASLCLCGSYSTIFLFPFLSELFLLLTFFFAGIPALIGAVEDIVKLDIEIDVLMTLAAFLSILIGNGREGGLLLVLFSFSSALEGWVTAKAKSALSSLKKIAPTKAFVVKEDGSIIEKSVKDILSGTLIHVKVGDVIPLDGKIVKGHSSVNLAHLTGEFLPQSKTQGDLVQAGSTNLEGALTIEVTHTSSHSTLERIIRLVVEAESHKPKFQNIIDRLSRIYALSIISLCILFTFSFPFLLNIPFLGNEGSLYRALAFLVAASPCALVLAVPITYLSAISVCARKGILLKGGAVLDRLFSCKVLAFDKTGTITQGELKFLGMEGQKSDEMEVLRLAYTLELNATHPIANAIVKMAEAKKLTPQSASDVILFPGQGISGKVEGKEVFIGNKEFILARCDLTLRESIENRIDEMAKNGEVVAILLHSKTEVFFLRFKDEIRPKVFETIASLKKDFKLKVLMLTGDQHLGASSVAKEVGIESFFSNLRPADKLAHISKLSEKEPLAMVGDGINDAPSLARADVGISMGRVGSQMAVDASDIVLLQDNIELLDWLWQKAKLTRNIVLQNMIFASLAILIASIPAIFGLLPLWLAVILHEGGTVLVGFNGLRLLKKDTLRTLDGRR